MLVSNHWFQEIWSLHIVLAICHCKCSIPPGLKGWHSDKGCCAPEGLKDAFFDAGMPVFRRMGCTLVLACFHLDHLHMFVGNQYQPLTNLHDAATSTLGLYYLKNEVPQPQTVVTTHETKTHHSSRNWMIKPTLLHPPFKIIYCTYKIPF